MGQVVGGCSCGAVRYAASAEPVLTAFCHCRFCQRGGGAGYSANVAVPAQSLSVEGAWKQYRTSGGSGQAVTRNFCAECGSLLALEAESFSGVILVQAGTLDDPSWVAPTFHMWCSSAQPWDHMPDAANCLPGNPPAAA